MKKVMIFGIFDGIHKGHRELFREAKQYGDYLIAVVAQDHIAEHLKGGLPATNFAERFEHLGKEDQVNEVAIGEPEASIARLVKRYHPDTVAFGADQEMLRKDFETQLPQLGFRPKIEMLKNHEPHDAEKR